MCVELFVVGCQCVEVCVVWVVVYLDYGVDECEVFVVVFCFCGGYVLCVGFDYGVVMCVDCGFGG